MLNHLLREESGSQTLEFVFMLPLVMLVLLLILQVAFVGFTVVVAEASVREAALVASRDTTLIDGFATAGAQSPISLTAQQTASGVLVEVQSVTCSSGIATVELQATVPNLLFESAFKFTLDATMPTQDGGC